MAEDRRLRAGSVCSGIGAPEVASAGLPIDWQFCAEIEAFPSAVLAARFPGVRNYGDFTKIGSAQAPTEPVDLLVGGTPCQSFSIAGVREGLQDPRGNLALEFAALARRLQARWVVWENAPGVLSSGKGRDFGAILGALAECGYGFAYRILDAQNFGVPQRRRRVFVVGCLGDWKRAASVLFEPAGVQGHPAPSRGSGTETAGALMAGASGRGWRVGADEAAAGHVVAHTLRGEGFDASEDGTGRGTPLVVAKALATSGGTRDVFQCHGSNVGPLGTLRRGSGTTAGGVPFTAHCHGGYTEGVGTLRAKGADCGGGSETLPSTAFHHKQNPISGEVSPCLSRNADGMGVFEKTHRVRRLTPRECERLQGFPDDFTAIDLPTKRGSKPAADGPRYKAIGNSMAVPVMRWILRRLVEADRI